MSRLRSFRIASVVLVVVVLAAALALAVYRREVIEDAEQHEHEAWMHHHEAWMQSEEQSRGPTSREGEDVGKATGKAHGVASHPRRAQQPGEGERPPVRRDEHRRHEHHHR